MTQQLMQAAGWTMIHSLWQGLIIFLGYQLISRMLPQGKASTRYGMGVAALGVLVIATTITFIIQLSPLSGGDNMPIVVTTSSAVAEGNYNISAVGTVLTWIDNNMIWLIRFWALGFAAGLIRIAAGLWYLRRLKLNATPVDSPWKELVLKLGEELGVNKMVVLAEARVSTPMVVGFVKPVILFPIGLMSGLSVEQVENILLHELSHIRRQDYLINLIQVIVESVLFFNPFVLLLSGSIREERENCCDDMAIAKGVDPLSYVKTLAHLEASRDSMRLAQAFAAHENQLLNRIRRIMEKSTRRNFAQQRLMPVALLALGLVLASWLSISPVGADEQEPMHSKRTALQDTTRKKSPHRRSIHDKQAKAELDRVPGPVPPAGIGFDYPDMIGILSDSLPMMTFTYRDKDGKLQEYSFKVDPNSKEFKEKYEEMTLAMAEFQRQLEADGPWKREFERMPALAQLDRMKAMDMRELSREQELMARELQELATVQEKIASERMMFDKEIAEDLKDQMLRVPDEREQTMWKQAFEEQQAALEMMNRDMEDFHISMNKLLIEDGYFTKDDDLSDLSFSDVNGELIINGKKIKEKDAKRYRELNSSFEKAPRRRYSNRPE